MIDPVVLLLLADPRSPTSKIVSSFPIILYGAQSVKAQETPVSAIRTVAPSQEVTKIVENIVIAKKMCAPVLFSLMKIQDNWVFEIDGVI
jgi:hypothetical protein